MPPATFKVPAVVDNDEGWGPTSVPDQLEGIPYAPFNKGDKFGKASDFTQSGFNKYGGGRGYGQQQPKEGWVFNFSHNEEEDSFHLVDNKPTQRRQGPRRFNVNRFQQANRREQERREGLPVEQKQRKKQQQRQQFYHRNNQQQTTYSSSVDIRPEWPVIEQVAFTSLVKLNYQVGEPTDLAFCGHLQYYDKTYDRITPKTERRLKRTARVFRSVTTSDDPIIRKLAKEESRVRVFATDTILTTLMCATRSVYSWDIIVTRVGDKVFFDKRDQSALDFLTVAETAPEPVPEERDNINGVHQLSVEATAVNQNFSQQVLLGGPSRFDTGEPNPFGEDEQGELAPVAYKYRKFSLAEDYELVVRCELDGVMSYKDEVQTLTIKALSEFDTKTTGVDWRQKLDTQRGAVLATELKNNANKLAKWTAGALISGVDLMKLGFLSRTTPRDHKNHAILGTQMTKPRDFASQINLNMDNCWGVIRAMVDLCLKQPEGKYLLLKDPNKPIMRLYEIPDDAFADNYTEEPLPENEEAPKGAVEKTGDEE